jgi:uncharacterized PurR-regulated membrane protein YhhQ (DUF165 family)
MQHVYFVVLNVPNVYICMCIRGTAKSQMTVDLQTILVQDQTFHLSNHAQEVTQLLVRTLLTSVWATLTSQRLSILWKNWLKQRGAATHTVILLPAGSHA